MTKNDLETILTNVFNGDINLSFVAKAKYSHDIIEINLINQEFFKKLGMNMESQFVGIWAKASGRIVSMRAIGGVNDVMRLFEDIDMYEVVCIDRK